MAAVNPNNRTRFKRFRVTLDASLLASTASLPLFVIDNLDSGGNVTTRSLSEFDLLLRDLGFDVPQFDYTDPEQ